MREDVDRCVAVRRDLRKADGSVARAQARNRPGGHAAGCRRSGGNPSLARALQCGHRREPSRGGVGPPPGGRRPHTAPRRRLLPSGRTPLAVKPCRFDLDGFACRLRGYVGAYAGRFLHMNQDFASWFGALRARGCFCVGSARTLDRAASGPRLRREAPHAWTRRWPRLMSARDLPREPTSGRAPWDYEAQAFRYARWMLKAEMAASLTLPGLLQHLQRLVKREAQPGTR